MKTQNLFLVVGGELEELSSLAFRDPNNLDIVGIFDGPEAAVAAWRGMAQKTVDNALMRYIILPLQPAIQAHQFKFA